MAPRSGVHYFGGKPPPAEQGEALKERLLEVAPNRQKPFVRKCFYDVIRSVEAYTSGDRAPCSLRDARPANNTTGYTLPTGPKAHLSNRCREFARIEAEVMKRGERNSGRLWWPLIRNRSRSRAMGPADPSLKALVRLSHDEQRRDATDGGPTISNLVPHPCARASHQVPTTS
jgi:hypothetical protein